MMILKELFEEEKYSSDEALEVMKDLVDSRTGIVRALIEEARRNDEPKIYSYIAWLSNTTHISDANVQRFAGGVSLDRKKAMVRCLGEAIERYCLAFYRRKDLKKCSYEELDEQALDPRRVATFSKKQFTDKRFGRFKYDEKSVFTWTKGYSLSQNEPLLLPAQLVYLPYLVEGEDYEPLILIPHSNGASGRSSFAGALCHGICEVIERDAVMINYLNKLPRERIDIKNSENDSIRKYIEVYARYGYELNIFDLTTDLEVPTMLTILIDRSGFGPEIVTGTSCDIDAEEAILSSIEGAKVGPGLRDVLQRNPNIDPMRIRDPNLARGLFWARRGMISHLDFLLKNDKVKDVKSLKNPSSHNFAQDLKYVLRIFEKKGIEVAFADVTTPDINDMGFKVVKVIIPELQPMSQYERYRYLGGERLYKVPKILGYKDKETTEDELNRIPHPFL